MTPRGGLMPLDHLVFPVLLLCHAESLCRAGYNRLLAAQHSSDGWAPQVAHRGCPRWEVGNRAAAHAAGAARKCSLQGKTAPIRAQQGRSTSAEAASGSHAGHPGASLISRPLYLRLLGCQGASSDLRQASRQWSCKTGMRAVLSAGGRAAAGHRSAAEGAASFGCSVSPESRL